MTSSTSLLDAGLAVVFVWAIWPLINDIKNYICRRFHL